MKIPFANKKRSSTLPYSLQTQCLDRQCYHIPSRLDEMRYKKRIKKIKLEVMRKYIMEQLPIIYGKYSISDFELRKEIRKK